MHASDLPALNATLNAATTLLLIAGYIAIRRNARQRHRQCMLAALACSALFLLSYLVYHYQVGSVPYPRRDWTRPLYFAVLVPHVVLAAANIPLVALVVWCARRGDFARHRRWARWLWPSWVFVGCSGVLVYWMLYHLSAL